MLVELPKGLRIEQKQQSDESDGSANQKQNSKPSVTGYLLWGIELPVLGRETGIQPGQFMRVAKQNETIYNHQREADEPDYEIALQEAQYTPACSRLEVSITPRLPQDRHPDRH
jgi:hypothetical protein